MVFSVFSVLDVQLSPWKDGASRDLMGCLQ